jgi:hypothetical protein
MAPGGVQGFPGIFDDPVRLFETRERPRLQQFGILDDEGLASAPLASSLARAASPHMPAYESSWRGATGGGSRLIRSQMARM